MKHPIVFQSYEEVKEAIRVKAIRPEYGIRTFSRYMEGELHFPTLVWIKNEAFSHQPNDNSEWSKEEYLIQLQRSKLWKEVREEFIITPTPMTIEELESKLGFKIKIIEETK